MNRLSILFVISAFWLASFAYCQDSNKIASIKIEGNKRIATETYLYYISSKPGATYDQESLMNDFKRLWGTGFLSNLQIKADETPAGFDVTFVVEEKPLIKVIEYTGNKKISTDDIQTKLKDDNIVIRIDQPYDPFLAKKVSNSIDKLMLEKGLQFGSTSFKTETTGESFAKLIFVVDEGPKVNIGEIVFEGNKVFTSSKLRKQMKDTKQRNLITWIMRKDDFEKEKFDKDMENVQELYYNNGYINARIDEPKIDLYEASGMLGKKKKRMRITIPVDEGNQFRTGDITFTGNTVLDSAALQQNFKGLQKGEVFNRSLLKVGVEDAQSMYGDEGYIYASLGPVFDVNKEQDVVNLKIQVEENGQFYVNRIEFTGNNYTRDKVIRRELLLQEGDLLRVSQFRASLDRIYRLGYFDDMKPNITPVTETKTADISIDLKENKRNEIRLGGGYSELEGFFGNVVFSTRNLFGTGKVFSVNIQGGSRTSIYEVSVLEPYFLDKRLTVGFSVYSTKYDYYNYKKDTLGASLSFGFPVFEEFKGLFTYSYQVINVGNFSSNGTPINPDLFPGINLFQQDRNESRLTPAISRTTINNPNDPTRGTRLIFASQFVGGFLGGELDYIKPTASYTIYLPGWIDPFGQAGTDDFRGNR